jgi:hypothetical protein
VIVFDDWPAGTLIATPATTAELLLETVTFVAAFVVPFNSIVQESDVPPVTVDGLNVTD